MSHAGSHIVPQLFSGVFSSKPFIFSRTKWTVRIVPRTGSALLQWTCLALIPLIGVGMGIVADEVAIAIFALFLGSCIWLASRVFDRSLLRRGPWFIFRLADGIVELPRLKVKIPRYHRKEFHIIVQDEAGRTHAINLTLVAWDTAGNPSHYPLVGENRAAGRSEMDGLARKLSRATGIPVCRERLHLDQTGCPCEKCGCDLHPTADRCAECGHQFLVLHA